MIEQRVVKDPTGLVGVLGLLGYSGLLMVVAIGLGGGGHGLRFPLVVFFAPASLVIFVMPRLASDAATWAAIAVMVLSWPLLGALLRRAATPQRPRLAWLGLVVHYSTGIIAAAITVQPEEVAFLSTSMTWFSLLMGFGVYAAGQVVLWRGFPRSARGVEP